MLRKIIQLFFIIQLVSFACKADPSTDSIISRYRQYFLKDLQIKGVDDSVALYVNSLNNNHQWNDIDYNDTSPSFWNTRRHLERVIALAIAYEVQSSRYYKNEQAWQTLSNGLDHWLEKRYLNNNWWHNEIGTPQYMRIILVLIGYKLKPLQLKNALEVLAQYKVRGVGANLIWSADLAIHYGAFTKNESIIKESTDLIAKEIKVSTGEGIQPDYSFHQHDSRLQQFHYGLSFFSETVRIGWEIRGTKWALPQEKLNILADFILKGWQWMSRGINIVPSTIDRASSRIDQLHNADIRPLLPYLIQLDPLHATSFKTIAERQNGKGEQLQGFRYFPYSDFTAYQQKDFSFFLKTISTRTLISENINGENIKGRLLNNGDAYMITDGKQYFNLMPAWNWKHLPGQTNSNLDSSIVRLTYAGSVTDGTSGLTAMDYGVAHNGRSITAHKFWACKNNTVVCLIANLTSTNNTDSMFTALDQSRLQGKVEVNTPGNFITEGKNEFTNVKWIYHANVGYINLLPSTVQVQVNSVVSSWNTINVSSPPNTTTEKVFMPLLYHPPLTSSSTGYVLTYSKTAKEVEQLAKAPGWKVVRNDSVCQGVEFKDGVSMAAFFSNGSIKFSSNKTITVDKPCLIQITKTAIYVSDALHNGSVVNVRFNNKTYSVKLNSDGTTTRVAISGNSKVISRR